MAPKATNVKKVPKLKVQGLSSLKRRIIKRYVYTLLIPENIFRFEQG